MKKKKAQTIKQIEAQVMNVFLSEFVDKVSHQDPFVAFICGHAYIDSLATVLLGSSLLMPSELDTNRMRFGEKIRLCTAMGLIHNDVAPALKKLGDIRNEFAHEIWPSFTAKEERDFLNVLRQSPRLKMELQKAKPTWTGVAASIWVLWEYLFKQLVRVTSNKATLVQLWKSVVDARDTEVKSLPLALGPRLNIAGSISNVFAVISRK
jgi:hypothetical protein